MDAKAIFDLTTSGLKKWSAQRRAEERDRQARLRRGVVMTHVHVDTARDVAARVLPQVYDAVSDHGKLPVLARQLMYRARPLIQKETGSNITDSYFTQHILPDFLRQYSHLTSNWDVLYDARGHFIEPHTGRSIPCGTLEVRRYLQRIKGEDSTTRDAVRVEREDLYPTIGRTNRFGGVLFIEKEGFHLLIERMGLARKYDLAILSTKGMSNVASRHLVDQVCRGYFGGSPSIPLFVLHDFDKAGFAILNSIQKSSRRYEFSNLPKAIDLGLRIDDVNRYGLEAEEVLFDHDPTWNLRKNGAEEEEIQFLYQGNGNGQRVELNALTTSDFVDMFDRKLQGHGAKKVIPDEKTLVKAYRRFVEAEAITRAIGEARKVAREKARNAEVPEGLQQRVRTALKRDPCLPWDDPVIRLARKELRP